MPVECRNAQRRLPLDTRRLQRIGGELLAALNRSQAVLSILVTDDQRIAKIHQRWLGTLEPTDVLSFRMSPAPGSSLLGDVVISAETARRRSPADPMGELIRYLIHGVLHLTGHDHVGLQDRRRMSRCARRLTKIARAIP